MRIVDWYDFIGQIVDVDELNGNTTIDESNECEGHESLNGAHMGESVYCDGSCL